MDDQDKADILQFVELKHAKQKSVIGRMNRNARVARLANEIYSIIESRTSQFKLELMSDILKVIEKEN